MDAWSPAQYRRFAAERRQPFDALVALCEPLRGGLAYDLGCGPGELTRELPRRLGVSHVVGVDSSAAMLESAAEHADESVSFEHGDLATFRSHAPVDILFSNAALHWAPDHAAVLAHWRAQLAPGGQLAVQPPCNGDHPAYQAIGITVAEQRALFPGPLPAVASAENVETVERYVEILHGLGASQLNVHLRVFPHALAGPLEVVEWVRGTALHPIRVALKDEAAYGAFLASYEARLRRILGPPDMPYLFTFKRIFLWARFDTPRGPVMNRLERLLDLVHVLQTARAPVSLDALRELFPDYADGSPDATRRKFERDKAELASLGLVLRFVSEEQAEHGGQDGYWLDADASYLPPIDLGPSDRALLAAAARAALGSEAFPHRAALRLALAKLDPSGTDDPAHAPLVMPGRSHEEPVSEQLEQLSAALGRRKRVTLVYQKPGSAPSERDVDPYALFSKSGVWHLCGFDHRRQATRVFRVSRIVSLVVNDKRPTQPDYEIPAGFRAADYSVMNPLRYEVSAPLTCRVHVDPEVAFLMRAPWGEPGPDGVFEVTTTNLPHLVQQVLSLGSRAELLSPPVARAAVVAQLEAVLAAHGEGARG